MAKKEKQKKEEPVVDNTVEKQKIKKKPSINKTNTDGITKINLNKKDTDGGEDVHVQNGSENSNTNSERIEGEGGVGSGERARRTSDGTGSQEQSTSKPEEKTIEETPILEEITEDSTEQEITEAEEQIEEVIAEAEVTGKPLPENIQKLMDFMVDTGGDLNDYVKLNQDYSKLDDQDVLYEYYKQTKPHLNNEEINFLMEDSFSYDEESDEERDIRRKKLALKEQVASARAHLDGQKSKYYEDIKAGSKLTAEQQKAIDFFNRYNKEEVENTKKIDKQKSDFLNKTNNVFNDKFKGFEYNVGDKKFRFNVKNANEVKDTQGDINNFVKKFLNEDGEISDAKGYHKSLYTAMNADAIAKHFYDQGQADAMKNSITKAKNIDMSPRQSHGEINAGGMKVKVLGDNSTDFKFKIKNKNK